MNQSNEYSDSKESAYVQMMADLKRKKVTEKKPVSAAQCASTQAILDRPKEKDVDHWNRPILNWKANPNAKNLDEAVGKRDLDVTQVLIAEDLRRQGKNSDGQSTETSAPLELKERAVHAFTYSQPATMNLDRIMLKAKMNAVIQTHHIEIKGLDNWGVPDDAFFGTDRAVQPERFKYKSDWFDRFFPNSGLWTRIKDFFRSIRKRKDYD